MIYQTDLNKSFLSQIEHGVRDGVTLAGLFIEAVERLKTYVYQIIAERYITTSYLLNQKT